MHILFQFSNITKLFKPKKPHSAPPPNPECYACTQFGIPAFHSASFGTHKVTNPNFQCSIPSANLAEHALDPRDSKVQKWNRIFLLARGVALYVDPLFLYALSLGRGGAPCVYLDGGLLASVTLLRTLLDAVHVCHAWLQTRLAYVSKESLVVGCGKLVWDRRQVARHYLGSVRGFWLDVFVILPVYQVIFWCLIPKLIRGDKIELIMTILLVMFVFHYIPKVYHWIWVMKKMQEVTGYVFGSIWWGFGLNLLTYFIASHVAGGLWYVLTMQRAVMCLRQGCVKSMGKCELSLGCSDDVCYEFLLPQDNLCWSNSTVVTKIPPCLNFNGPFRYGIYQWGLAVISSTSVPVKILYPFFWGLITLSTFGNILSPTSQWLEVIFSIFLVLGGLMLFTLLIGNIQVFLDVVTAKKKKMQLRCRDIEYWMGRRQLPLKLRHRVRHFERHTWATMNGEDEMSLIKDLPEGLRRDIKRHLCIDLIKKVPFFHNLDDIILDNICDRVRPLVFTKDEKIITEGDAVQRMIFVVRGQLISTRSLSRGNLATNTLEPGSFLGDELLYWCLRRPFNPCLPASTATFLATETTEAFSIKALDLRYVSDHFRYKFGNEKLKRTIRYYSSNWRTWGAVNVQLAWRRYIAKTRPRLDLVHENGDSVSERKLRQYAVMFMSLRPHDHLE